MRLHVERPPERSLIVAMDLGCSADTTVFALFEKFQDQAARLCGVTDDMLEAQRWVRQHMSFWP